MLELHHDAWIEVATAHGFDPPDADDVQRAMQMRPERAINGIFHWTDDFLEARKLSFEHYEAFQERFQQHEFVATPGCKEWLETLNQYEVPCCLCCTFDEPSVRVALQRAGIRHLYQELVTAEDGCDTREQALLLACLKVQRPPSRCVVFEDEPQGVVDAHEISSKAIALVGKHPGYALMHADKRVLGFDDLQIQVLKEVFTDFSVT